MDTENVVSTKMQQIALNAKRLSQTSFTSLAYHIDMMWLYESFKSTRKDGAVGVDNQTAESYEKELKQNLESLLEQFKSGKYKAPPVRRVYIPKDGKKEMRPLGIPTFEDKILQKAVKMVIEPIYEQDFYDCSYGFRPGKGQHDALQELWSKLMKMGGGWIIDMDMRKFFDSIKWNYLCDILKLRVRDGVLIRTIGKWMNAGIMEDGNMHYTDAGTPQGGVISPLLSNIFLHEVVDKWFHTEVVNRLKGQAFEIRFADDTLLCFENKEDALKVLDVLPKRLEKYGLELNAEKTKLVHFKRPSNDDDYKRGRRRDAFNFLGFTHYWKNSRKGNPIIARKTQKERLSRALIKLNEWCKYNRHLKLELQQKKLNQKLRGHYGYYGVTGNFKRISNYFTNAERFWHKWLNRRNRNRNLCWIKMRKILNRYPLSRPKIVHSYV